MNRLLRIGILLGLSTAAFLLFLNGPDIVTSHEARVALPAREMADSGWPWAAAPAKVQPVKLVTHAGGILRLESNWQLEAIPVNPWLVPDLTGQIRLQKPPLPYWCAAVVFRLFGGFSDVTVRIVPALLGAIAVLLIFDLGRLLYGRRVGWLAAIAWVSSYSIPEEYRKAMADPYLAFFSLACIWSWVRASRGNERLVPPGSKPASTSICLLLAFYFSFGMALLAKGPIAFLDILVPLVVFHLCFRGRAPRPVWMHFVGLLLMFAIALPWPIYVLRNVPDAMKMWKYESVGELGENTENARSWYFYVPQIFFLSLPWTLPWVMAVARQCLRAVRRVNSRITANVLAKEMRRMPAQRATAPHAEPRPLSYFEGDLPLRLRLRPDLRHFFPLVWFFVMVVFFSFVHLKKNQYLLPSLPALTLMIGQGLGLIFVLTRKRRIRYQAIILFLLQAIFGIVFAVALVVMVRGAGHVHGLGFVAVVCISVMSIAPLIAAATRKPQTWLVVQAAVYVLLFLAFGHFYFTPKESERSPRQVAAELEVLLHAQPGEPRRTLLTTQVPEEVALYLPTDVRYDFGSTRVLVVVDDQHGAMARALTHLARPEPQIANFAVPAGPGESRPPPITDVRQIHLASAPGDARWKVYELTVLRRM